MREYLFRGKRPDNGKWVEGSLIIRTIGSFIVDVNNRSSLRYCSDSVFSFDSLLVDPATVGQYTGLKDKNGVKIFEGDILRRVFHPYDDYIVEWNDGGFSFRKRIYPREYGYESLVCCQNAVSILKVIGNIYDNPELLKEGGEE